MYLYVFKILTCILHRVAYGFWPFLSPYDGAYSFGNMQKLTYTSQYAALPKSFVFVAFKFTASKRASLLSKESFMR